ncbi:hypothetical protein HPB51_005509 [Rhipicephalus microplus]|uniref:Uncharacterized protein n=1 Tax=Rhipicephalus microplus TaxID=6941 RepID=A0A9J6EYA4_RHIMP|nr:hypothetical protein HPB51_005509 [Rhipicephalus microplus]
MELFADEDSVCPVPKDNSSCPLQVQEMFVSFPESIEPPDKPNMLMEHGQQKHVMGITNNPTERPANIPEGQPFAQHVNLSDENTKSTVDVVQSLRGPPSTLTSVKSEPLAQGRPPEASADSLSGIFPTPVQPPPPVARNKAPSTKPASKKRKPKTQAKKTALGVSVQPLQLHSMKPFTTLGVNSIASDSASALMWFPQSP